MERISKFIRIVGTVSAVIATLSGGMALGGTVLVQPKTEPPLKPGEAYPESRFGMPPQNPEVGISSGYASRAVEEMETRSSENGDEDEDAGPRAASRMPAANSFNRRPSDNGSRAKASPAAREQGESPAVADKSTVVTDSAVARKGIQEVALIAGDLGFFPKTFFVTRDVPVRVFVTGASKNTLCIMMDSFGVRKQIRSQKIEEITFTPAHPGKYRYYCPVNGMEGTMIVKDLAAAVVTPAEQ
jgi:plastocyanin